MRTIDADTHLVESERTWDFMDERFARYKPKLLRNTDPQAPGTQREFWLIDGRSFPKRVFDYERSGTTEETREARSIEARLAHMDELGVDVQVLYPTLFLLTVTGKPDVEYALHTCYNRWTADVAARGQGRLRWAALLPWLLMDKALEELQWAAAHGACAVHMRPWETGRPPTSPYFFPLYEEASRLNLPICLHAGLGSTLLVDAYSYPETVFTQTKLPAVSCFHALVMSDVPQRFPELRFGLIETSASWLPYVLHDIPPRKERLLGQSFDRGRNLLRENRIFVACQTDDDLPYVLSYVGEDSLVIGSDYGHADTSSELAALRHLQEMRQLEPRVVDNILCANARALYGF
jgi:predicted TIM-barrel fold metal-dependent hydrolase